MKKTIVTLLIGFVMLGTSSLFAGEWVKVKDKPFKEGTPEFVAAAYLDALIAGDAKKALSLCDAKLKKNLTYQNNKSLNFWIKTWKESAKNMDKEKYYRYKVTPKENGIVEVAISIGRKDSPWKRYDKSLNIIKEGEKYLVTTR